MVDNKFLFNLCQVPSKSGKEEKMIAFIESSLKKMNNISYELDKSNNIYVVKGNAGTYPCIVAHMDTVFEENPNLTVLKSEDVVFGYDFNALHPTGIGFDDKIGIYLAFKALEKYSNIKVAFFVKEEIGCIGSQAANMDFFKDVRFVIQADRKGDSDFISKAGSIELCSKEFIEDCKLSEFNYKEVIGLCTDVKQLKENGLEVSCVNLSCGYFNPHTDNECIRLSGVEKCWKFIQHIINNCKKVYPHKYEKPVVHYTSEPKFSSYYGFTRKEYNEAMDQLKVDLKVYLETGINTTFYKFWRENYNKYPALGYSDMFHVYQALEFSGDYENYYDCH